MEEFLERHRMYLRFMHRMAFYSLNAAKKTIHLPKLVVRLFFAAVRCILCGMAIILGVVSHRTYTCYITTAESVPLYIKHMEFLN